MNLNGCVKGKNKKMKDGELCDMWKRVVILGIMYCKNVIQWIKNEQEKLVEQNRVASMAPNASNKGTLQDDMEWFIETSKGNSKVLS